jgi:hypothetical protein
MIKNAAFLAALTVFLCGAWLAGELTFLARVKGPLFHRHGLAMGLGTLLVFFNLFAVYYACARWLFLRDTGRKLQHLDRQLGTPDTALDDLRERLES